MVAIDPRPLTADDFDSPLDPGIAHAVLTLQAAGVETFESCEGGQGHAYPEPTVRFHGQQGEGFRAFAHAQAAGLPVRELRRGWMIVDGEPAGPWWELVFHPTTVQPQLPTESIEARALATERLPAGA